MVRRSETKIIKKVEIASVLVWIEDETNSHRCLMVVGFRELPDPRLFLGLSEYAPLCVLWITDGSNLRDAVGGDFDQRAGSAWKIRTCHRASAGVMTTM